MHFLPLRLQQGADIRQELERIYKNGTDAAFVISRIGSLLNPKIRYAGETVETIFHGPYEILTLAGSVTPTGAHIHISISDKEGNVKGGHLCYGNLVHTTAEILLANVTAWNLSREHDSNTGYSELIVDTRVRDGANDA